MKPLAGNDPRLFQDYLPGILSKYFVQIYVPRVVEYG